MIIYSLKIHHEMIFFRDGSHIDRNVRNADQLLSHIQKNNSLAFYITGNSHDINSDNVKMITNGKLYTEIKPVNNLTIFLFLFYLIFSCMLIKIKLNIFTFN